MEHPEDRGYKELEAASSYFCKVLEEQIDFVVLPDFQAFQSQVWPFEVPPLTSSISEVKQLTIKDLGRLKDRKDEIETNFVFNQEIFRDFKTLSQQTASIEKKFF